MTRFPRSPSRSSCPFRPAVAPNIPTLDEAGLKGYEADTWYGLFAPARTPAPVLDKLNSDIVAALNSPEIRAIYEKEGAVIVADSRAAFTDRLRADVAKWKSVIADLKLKID